MSSPSMWSNLQRKVNNDRNRDRYADLQIRPLGGPLELLSILSLWRRCATVSMLVVP